MLYEQVKLRKRVAMTWDIISVLIAFMLAYQTRSLIEPLLDIRYHAWILLVVFPVWFGLLVQFDLYRSIPVRTNREILTSVFLVHVIGGIIVAAFLFLFEPQGYSRGLFLNFIVFSALIFSTQKLVLKFIYRNRMKNGQLFRHVLVVGTGEKSRNFVRLLRQHEDWGLKVAGVLSMEERENREEFNDSRIIGDLDDLVEICTKITVDEVVFCPEGDSRRNMEESISRLEEMGTKVRMVLDSIELPFARMELDIFHGELPILTLHHNRHKEEWLLIKRCMDIAGGIVGMAILAILLPFIALAIKLESRGPIFFGQDRVGANGRIFRCWKFRTMLADAEMRKKDLTHMNEMNGAVFKIRDDPRVTRLGRFLRRVSLDEWPQFWNVLHGEMSLVGARPPTPDEVERYEHWHRKRISTKPGLTGLWQVSGRNQVRDFDEIARLDIKYIENWSLWLDIKILFKTIFTMFSGHGAY
jgi:exopolysaccharide biosynthesis polyprenyl glycosylphosphotransferase